MDTGKLIDSMKRVVKSELGSYDTTATVKRVEGDTAWVHIPGGVDETPVRLTMNAKEGDNVQVRVSDGKAFLAGNVSAPPTDDTTAEAAKALANRAAEDAGRAKSAADIAETYATSAQASAAQSATILEGMEQAATAAGTTLDGIYADAAEAKATTDEINDYADTAGKTVTQILNDGETAGAAASAAQQAADTALVNLATTEDVVGVLNWITAHGTMVSQYGEVFDPDKVYFIADPTGDYVVSGTHYSVVPSPVAEDIDSYYILNISESVQNYVATHIVVDTEGLWIIPDAGGNKVLIATGSGSTYTTAGTYIIGKVGGVDTVFAKFLSSGATMQAENGTTIAHLGYGPGKNSAGGTSNAPYYTLGKRTSNSTVGNYSMAEGFNNSASGTYAHAEGHATSATEAYSHAEGWGSVATGEAAHAEGSNAAARGYCSHAEGFYTNASGSLSHAQNEGTIAQRRSQTAIGEYNVADTTGASGMVRGDYAVIVGNGTADNARSNALTVDWSGNVNIASGAKYKINGTNLSASDVGALAEDANGDISITRNITAGGNVEAAGGMNIGSGQYYQMNGVKVVPPNALAHARMASSTNMNIASSTWKNLDAFTGHQKIDDYINTEYFGTGTSGFVVKKAGIYHITADCHMTGASAGNAYAIKIYNFTTSSNIGNVRFGYANGVAWVDFSIEVVASVGANQTIVPQFERYSGSANWRPQTATFTIQCIALS